MKTILLTVTLAALAAAALAAGLEETCFHKGEKVDGNNKICYYDCPSGEAATTVKSYQLCPLRITRTSSASWSRKGPHSHSALMSSEDTWLWIAFVLVVLGAMVILYVLMRTLR